MLKKKIMSDQCMVAYVPMFISFFQVTCSEVTRKRKASRSATWTQQGADPILVTHL